jgi:hypothetical protein
MEATLRISLCSYSYYLLCFLFNKIKEERTGSAWKRAVGGDVEVWGQVAQTKYTHVNECKNNKIKEEKKREC